MTTGEALVVDEFTVYQYNNPLLYFMIRERRLSPAFSTSPIPLLRTKYLK